MFTRTPIVVQRKLTGQKPKIIRFMKALLRGFNRSGYAFRFFFLSLFLLVFFFGLLFFFFKKWFSVFVFGCVIPYFLYEVCFFCFCFFFWFVIVSFVIKWAFIILQAFVSTLVGVCLSGWRGQLNWY